MSVMKTTSLAFLFVLLASFSILSAKDIEINGNFIFKTKSFTYKYTSSSTTTHKMEMSLNEVKKNTSLNEEGQQGKEIYQFSLESFSIDIFRPLFFSAVKELTKDLGITTKDTENAAAEVFFSIQARKDLIDDQPVTAKLVVKSNIIKSFLSVNKSFYYGGKLSDIQLRHELIDIELEFEQGTIKNINLRLREVDSTDLRNYLIFTNRFPFTISSKFDSESLSRLRLYCNDCGGVENLTRFVKLGDILSLDNKLENYKEDYSPVDGTITLNTSEPVKELRKEKRSEIIEVTAFTDLLGIDETNPNGLLQIEASRKINLFTKHYNSSLRRRDLSNFFDYGSGNIRVEFVRKISKKNGLYSLKFFPPESLKTTQKPGEYYKKVEEINSKQPDSITKKTAPDLKADTSTLNYLTRNSFDSKINRKLIPGVKNIGQVKREKIRKQMEENGSNKAIYKMKIKDFNETYFNYFGYIEPKFKFSKIEQNERNFTYSDSQISDSIIFINPIDMYRYQKIALGIDLNVLKINFTNLKFSLLLNSGINWYKTGIKSGQAEDLVKNIDSFNYNFSGLVKFFPDGRWGASVGYEYQRNFVLNETVNYSVNPEILQYKFDGYMKTNATDKLFFRFRLSHQLGNIKNLFSQIQLGYSMDIFGVKAK